VLAVLGCGVQARSNLEALRLVFPSLSTVRAFDVEAAAVERYRSEMTAEHPVEVLACPSPREAFAGADLVLTCGPITPGAERVAHPNWLEPGATVVTLDYDCYFQRGALAAADGLFTDDVQQLEHTKQFGYFEGLTALEVAPFCARGSTVRHAPGQRLVSINMGVAVEDTATAARIYERALAMGIGTRLPI
jgi:ornithine cyclodeaminase/alanine dehydrogenase